MKSNIGFLCSGELGLNCLKMINNQINPQFIFTDKNSTGIIEYANEMKIPIFIGNPRNERPLVFLNEFETDLIFSINYLFIVNQDILKHPVKYAINFHGSLLPKYRGRTPHVWAIINGEKKTGITAHIMENDCDTGDIVLQERVNIAPNDTGAKILQVYKEKYPAMILKVIDLIENNLLNLMKQDNDTATYFGKRTPDDGKINWNWQKERIVNWVRAQAYPYPGAFTVLNGERIIIDKISYSDFGFENQMPNGFIIKTTPNVLVKTPNGVIELTVVRNFENIDFKRTNQFE